MEDGVSTFFSCRKTEISSSCPNTKLQLTAFPATAEESAVSVSDVAEKNRKRLVVDGEWWVASGEWWVVSGGWRVVGGEWWAASGVWWVVSGGRRVVSGGWSSEWWVVGGEW